ncbi:MAG: hypothetical protein E7C91_09720 [Veillonella sp.]|nr:hypothetical protein [Veillonella sp.]
MTAEQKAATAATSSTAAKPIPEQGTEWIICRVCGYIEDAKYRDQPCPTCGFPPTVWMDYKPRRIDSKREKLLDLHLHPIAVHFPIAATAASFLVPVIALLIPSIANVLFPAITLVVMILPLLVIIGGISGYIGSKIYLTVIYFILSCAQAYIAIANGVNADNAWIMIILGIVASIFAAKLGKMGSYLFAGRFGPYTAG